MPVIRSISFLLLFTLTASAGAPVPFTVMTFNIRLDVASDGPNAWEHRKEMVTALVRHYGVSLLGIQEALPHQLDYLKEHLPEYGVFGVGRDDGKRAGEIMAILYRKERFDTLATATHWCSPTPDRPGLGWDAACNRTVTYGRMKDRIDGKVFHYYNTHLDHVGTTARAESAKLIRRLVAAVPATEPVLVTGDFNATPDSEPYRIITQNEGGRGLKDARALSAAKPYGPSGTFTGFDLTAAPKQPIDFIFVSDGVTVERFAVHSETTDGRLPSDHYPVSASVRWGK